MEPDEDCCANPKPRVVKQHAGFGGWALMKCDNCGEEWDER